MEAIKKEIIRNVANDFFFRLRITGTKLYLVILGFNTKLNKSYMSNRPYLGPKTTKRINHTYLIRKMEKNGKTNF